MIDLSKKNDLNSMRRTVSFFENILRATPDGVVITDSSQNIVSVNELFCDFVGNDYKSVLETNLYVWLNRLSPDAPAKWANLETDIRRNGTPGNVEFRTGIKGEERFYKVNASTLGEPFTNGLGCVVSIWRDVTIEKTANRKLKAFQQNLKKIVRKRTKEVRVFAEFSKVNPHPVLIYDNKGDILFANLAMEQLRESLSIAKLDNINLLFRYNYKHLLDIIGTNKTIVDEEKVLNGMSFLMTCNSFKDQNAGFITLHNITEIKRTKLELQNRAAQSEAAAKISNFLIKVKSEDEIYAIMPEIISASFNFDATAIEMYDPATNEVVLKGCCGIKKEDAMPSKENADKTIAGSVIKNAKSIKIDDIQNQSEYNLEHLKKAGFIYIACYPLRTGDKVIGALSLAGFERAQISDNLNSTLQTVSDSIAQSIDRKRSNQQLRQYSEHLEELVESRTAELRKSQKNLATAEKLAAIGKLSAAIAHEFNNPICGIRNVLELIARDKFTVNELTERDELVALALNDCDRMAGLIRNLLYFHGPAEGKAAPINICDAVNDACMIYKKRLEKSRIKLEVKNRCGKAMVTATPAYIKQALLNIMQNAEEAMQKNSGVIFVSTEQDESKIAIHIEDTGAGIKPEYLDKIFDPFFSTKTAVKGTGLGLSISYGIIKTYNGDIEVKSQPEKGSSFTINFPVAKEVTYG